MNTGSGNHKSGRKGVGCQSDLNQECYHLLPHLPNKRVLNQEGKEHDNTSGAGIVRAVEAQGDAAPYRVIISKVILLPCRGSHGQLTSLLHFCHFNLPSYCFTRFGSWRPPERLLLVHTRIYRPFINTVTIPRFVGSLGIIINHTTIAGFSVRRYLILLSSIQAGPIQRHGKSFRRYRRPQSRKSHCSQYLVAKIFIKF